MQKYNDVLMLTENEPDWRCPVCEQKLIRQIAGWQCIEKHSFDCAKEGYVNLLLAQHKNSKMPGDNKEMVLARRAFLSQDYYLPLATKLAQLIKSHCSILNADGDSVFSLFDAGCGEGYYLEQIAKHLLLSEGNTKSFRFSGIDIAKPAIQKAAKRSIIINNQSLSFAVASAYNLPVMNASQHAVMQVFAPSSNKEIHRILALNGIWITVNPAPDHLFELKSLVYDQPQTHSIESDIPEGFELLTSEQLKFEVSLSTTQTRENLLKMTPFYWTISKEKKEKLLNELETTHAHFDIKVLAKI